MQNDDNVKLSPAQEAMGLSIWTIVAIECWTDQLGTAYALLTKEGPVIHTGLVNGQAQVQVTGRAMYSGPEADRVLAFAMVKWDHLQQEIARS